MFTTLFAHEVRTLAPKIGIIAGIGALIIAVSLGLSALKIPYVSGLLMLTTAVTAVAIPLAILILVAGIYWKTMHCDAGYFTHTLPVTGGQLFWAKTLFAYMAGLFGLFMSIGGILAVTVQIAWMNGLPPGEIASSMIDSWSALTVTMKAFLIIVVFLQLANSVFSIAAVMSIGARSTWNHMGFGAPVIGFVLLYLANQIAALFGMLLLPGGLDTATGEFTWGFMLPELIEAMNGGSNTTPFIGMGQIVTTSLVTIAVVWWGVRSLNRHLSLR
ncbi:beta-carotene 15,15'-monooxygenase [Actinomyces mediterranea]|uniref:beta-carotene 15,15'-monooxygenase n=1 Tax=Actinomyces mediterranea TaxID=1871028 RepID=UPI0009712095|nr:beta-carotene 15,15'-monooxygenase [Actinomyces mediterranea]